LTDFDPKGEAVSQEDADPDDEGVGNCYGENRVVNHIMKHVLDSEEWKKSSFQEILDLSEENGIFLNEFTFEVDLFKAGAEEEFAETIKGLSGNKKMRKRFEALVDDPDSLDPKQFLKDIDSLGKGRIAQRLASVLLSREVDISPPYIAAALDYMKDRLA
jgi:putative ATP-dependent endonuclease of OLD family